MGKRNHIPTNDFGTHLATLCGAFPRTIEDCMGNDGGVCLKCRKEFVRTPEQIKAYSNALMKQGESFNFGKEPMACPTHPAVSVRPGGGGCGLCAQEVRQTS